MIHPTSAGAPTGPTAGFTLIEMLVALTLLALLAAGLATAVGSGNRAVVATDALLDRSNEIAVAYEFLRNQLGAAQPMPAGAGADSDEILFDGGPDHVAFVALPPDHLTVGGFDRLRVGLSGSAGGQDLVVAWRTLPRAWRDAERVAAAPTVLLRRVGALAFSYFGQAEANAPFAWHPYWRAAVALPRLVKMSARFTDGRAAPDLIVAMRLAYR